MSPIIDLAPLLAPLGDDAPCGESLKHAPLYDAIATARQADDASLPQGVWKTELKTADWPRVIELCGHALSERSKDIRIAAWMGEAWIAHAGIEGGIAATQLMHGLCERYWDAGLHPLVQDGDLEFRSLPLAWANDKWSDALLLNVVLLRSTAADAVGYTLADWTDASATENSGRKHKQALETAIKTGAPLQGLILEEATKTTLAALQEGVAGIRAWKDALLALQLTLDLHLPKGTGSLSKLQRTLVKCEDLLLQCMTQHPRYVAPVIIAPAPPLPPSSDLEPATMQTILEAPALPQITGREDAYRQLAVIAGYLAQIEPHSPVPALISRAILWGRLPFDQLMGELMQNGGELQKLLLRVTN